MNTDASRKRVPTGVTESLPHALYDGPPEALSRPFLELVQKLTRAEPLRPIVVFTPTTIARLFLQRTLGRSGIANVHFTTLDGFVHELYPLVAADPRPMLPTGAERLLLAQIAPHVLADGYFAQVADRSGFHLALLATINDLREACIEREQLMEALEHAPVRAGLEELPGKLRALCAVWAAYEQQLRAHGCVDLLDMYRDVMAGLENWPLLQRKPICIAYGFYDLKGIQFRLLRALSELCPLIVFMPHEPTEGYGYTLRTHDALSHAFGVPWRTLRWDPPPTALGQLKQYLFGDVPQQQAPSDGSVRIVSVPTTGSEPEFVVRLLVQMLAEGIEPHRIAVLTRDAELASQVRRSCRDHQLACVDLDEDGLCSSPFGQLITGLLELAAEPEMTHRFNRDDVLHVLELAETLQDPTPAETDDYDLSTLWDLLAREAGIVSGPEEWQRKLAQLARRLRPSTDDQEETDPHLEARHRALKRLRYLTERLFAACDRLREAEDWSERVEALQQLCGLLLERAGDEVAQAREELLVQLRALADFAPEKADFATFAETVQTLLDSMPAASDAEYMEAGVVVGDVMRARSAEFDVVIVPGMASRLYPPPVRQDPILLDRERRWLNDLFAGRPPVELLPLRQYRADEEKLLFRLAIGLADRRVVLSYPRHESGRSRFVLPSPYILDVLRALGHSTAFEELSDPKTDSRIGLERVSVNPAHRAEHWCLGQAERLRQEVLAAAAVSPTDPAPWAAATAINPLLSLALEGEHARWGQRVYTPFDGQIDPALAGQLIRSVSPDHRFTVSHIDDFAQCPYYFWLKHVLGLEPDDDPTRTYHADPFVMGQLAHDVLQMAFARLAADEQLFRSQDRHQVANLVRACVDEVLDRMDAVPGFPLAWQIELRLLIEALERFVLDELQRLRDEGRKPVAFEETFGRESGQGVAIKLASGVELEIRGRIDRIDRDVDGHWYVVDYKRRGIRRFRQAGPGVQLPAYAVAAAERLGFREEHFGGLEYLFYQEPDRKWLYLDEFDEFDTVRQHLQDAAHACISSIYAGRFIQLPAEGACEFCAFQDVCLGRQDYVHEYKTEGDEPHRAEQ